MDAFLAAAVGSHSYITFKMVAEMIKVGGRKRRKEVYTCISIGGRDDQRTEEETREGLVCVCVGECECVCVREKEGERERVSEREREREYVFGCICVVCVCVCVCAYRVQTSNLLNPPLNPPGDRAWGGEGFQCL